MTDNDVFNGLGVELEALDREDFLKLRETLTRIGSRGPGNVLNQTCYVLHKRGRYALMHHAEMRVMDGEAVMLSEDDVLHRNTVACLLDRWGLARAVDDSVLDSDQTDDVTVITHRDKSRYSLVPLYEIGKVGNR